MRHSAARKPAGQKTGASKSRLVLSPPHTPCDHGLHRTLKKNARATAGTLSAQGASPRMLVRAPPAVSARDPRRECGVLALICLSSRYRPRSAYPVAGPPPDYSGPHGTSTHMRQKSRARARKTAMLHLMKIGFCIVPRTEVQQQGLWGPLGSILFGPQNGFGDSYYNRFYAV